MQFFVILHHFQIDIEPQLERTSYAGVMDNKDARADAIGEFEIDALGDFAIGSTCPCSISKLVILYTTMKHLHLV